MHGFIIFRNDDKAACVLVQAMHNPWSLYAIDDGFFLDFVRANPKIFKMIQKRIHKRSLASLLARRWVRIDARVFIDNRKIVIFKNNINIDIFRQKFHLFNFPLDTNLITAINFFIFGKIFAIAKNFPFFNHFLQITARFFRKKRRQKSIHTTRLARISQHTKK